MSSSTKAIVTKNSTINNNDRKRPLSSSARLSSPPTSVKRRGFSSSSSSSRPNDDDTIHFTETNQDRSRATIETNDRIDFQRDSFSDFEHSTHRTESNGLSTTLSHTSLQKSDIQDEYSKLNNSESVYESRKPNQQGKKDGSFNEHILPKRVHPNLLPNTAKSIDATNEPTYTKRSSSIAFIVKSASNCAPDQRTLISNGDSDDESERLRSNSTSNSTKTNNLIPSALMTIFAGTDPSKKPTRAENSVIIQQIDGNSNITSSTRLLTLVVPQSNNVLSSSAVTSSSIKMLSHGDGFASALRVPTKIQLTKTSYASSQHGDKNSSVISSLSNLSIHQEQTSLSSNSNALIDIPIETTERQQPVMIDYPSSTTLPPTPPPPVLDQANSRNGNKFSRPSNMTHQHQVEQEQEKQIRNLHSAKNSQDSDRSKVVKSSSQSSATTANTITHENSSSVSDWSVPPTSELSPTSITSSSPDISHHVAPSDDPSIDSESTSIPKSSPNREKQTHQLSSNTFPLLSSSPSMCCSESNGSISTSFNTKSVASLSKVPTNRTTPNDGKKTNNKSSRNKTASSPKLRRRRSDNENIVIHQQKSRSSKSKTKPNSILCDDSSIVRELMSQMVDQVAAATETGENIHKVLIIPVQKIMFSVSTDQPQTKKAPIRARGDVIQSRTSTITKKRSAISQSSSARTFTESRSIDLKSKDMDEAAFLLYASEHRSEFERQDTPEVAEQRMRSNWSRMSNHDKRVFYTRVLEAYRRPYFETISKLTANRSSSIETNVLANKADFDKDNANQPVTTAQLQRQTSTPLSFHSITSTDELSNTSPHNSTSKLTIFNDVVNELIEGGSNGLDKLSCTLVELSSDIKDFVSKPYDQRIKILQEFEEKAEKTSSFQLKRANLFCDKRIKYFASKHSVHTSDQLMNELTVIVKYFYLYLLSLKQRKQNDQHNNALANLLNGNAGFDESYISTTLTSIIEDLILTSSLANDYLASQPFVISQVEHSLPFVRNTELENELLNKNETLSINNAFSSLNDLEEYLNQCAHPTTTNIPYYSTQPVHHSSAYYSNYHNQSNYYYRSPSNPVDMNNYYFNATTPYQQHALQHYPYSTGSAAYYHHNSQPGYSANEQYQNYYYSSQPTSTAYQTSSNSNPNSMDIPTPHSMYQHRVYRPNNSDVARQYNKSQGLMASSSTSSTPNMAANFDGTNLIASQSKPMNSIVTNYPP